MSNATPPAASTAGDTTQDTLPDLSRIPRATPLPPATPPDTVSWDADTQSQHGDVYLLSGNVEVHYRDHILRADTISYDKNTGELTAEGHVDLSGGENDEHITASHGTYNLQTGTGRFYDVTGSVGLHGAAATPDASGRTGLVTPNPFLFSGRIVVKTGPRTYDIYDGSVTSCLLPHPDWLLSAGHLSVDEERARAKASVFHLIGIPLLFMPYVTHPVDTEERQSGILIPEPGHSSTKGWIMGEQYYQALGRSADLTMGLLYYSLRGWAESATFRGKGAGDDSFQAHFSALQDRGYTPTGGVYTNQGGEDVTAAFRKQLEDHTRLVGDGEYLSSYVYREAFTENFNQAVSSDITSIGYLAYQNNGIALDARADRYQGLKVIPINTTPGEEVHILHVPSLDASVIDHPFGPFLLSFTGSSAGLKRTQPDFTSSGIIERLDLRPEISLPLSGDGWHILASLAARETFYSRSATPYAPGQAPVELTTPINRADIDLQIVARPPAIERTFEVPERFQNLFGTEVRHTVEPEITYRNVHGINNFLSILRFDDIDLASDTDQIEYGVTQRLFFKPRPKPAREIPGQPAGKGANPRANCPAVPTASANGVDLPAAQALPELPDVLNPTPDQSTDANGIPDASAEAPQSPTRTRAAKKSLDPCSQPAPAQQQEFFSWRLTQRYFFDPTFGHAVVTARRNIFDSTLDFSGVAFLTQPRNISPLVSRMRFRTSGHTDVGWDFDYDTGAKKFTSSNVYVEARANNLFGGVSFADLNAPGRSEEIIDDNNGQQTPVTSPVSNFKQMRLLGGFGDPNRPGLAIAANAGLDLKLGQVQYGTLQATWNWNCCGLTVEYRRYELGSVSNESAEKFSFTIANIGSAGNLRRAERIF